MNENFSLKNYLLKIKEGFKHYRISITNDNVDILLRRIIATIIDTIILIIPLFALFFLMISVKDSLSLILFLLVFFIMMFIPILFYHFVMNAVFKGTIGKHICGIEIVDFDGNKIGFFKSFLRELIKYLLNVFTGGLFVLISLSSIFSSKNQTIYDICSLTIVRRKQK